MFKIIRKRKAKFPVLKPPATLLTKIGKVIEGGIIDNILRQETADGGRIQANSPQVREMKRKLGLPGLSLVFKEHSFVKGQGRSWRVTVNESKGQIIVAPASDELATVSEALQGRGYVGWFAISERTMSAIRDLLREWIESEFSNAALR